MRVRFCYNFCCHQPQVFWTGRCVNRASDFQQRSNYGSYVSKTRKKKHSTGFSHNQWQDWPVLALFSFWAASNLLFRNFGIFRSIISPGLGALGPQEWRIAIIAIRKVNSVSNYNYVSWQLWTLSVSTEGHCTNLQCWSHCSTQSTPIGWAEHQTWDFIIKFSVWKLRLSTRSESEE